MRTERTETTTTVRHIAVPLDAKGRENPPHLGDLRRFVEECEGLPDSLRVSIRNGNLSESGRHDTTFEVTWRQPVVPE